MICSTKRRAKAAAIASAGGLLVVMDLCIAVMYRVLGVPAR